MREACHKTMKRIQRKNRKLGTYKINNYFYFYDYYYSMTISSSYFDNKIYTLDDGIKTLSYGHKNSS